MKYKEEQLSGSRWVRPNQIHISNSYGGTPQITFHEELITEMSDGTTVNGNYSTLTENFSDPTKTFDLIDSTTGAVIRVATYQEVYDILRSLYVALATQRDQN